MEVNSSCDTSGAFGFIVKLPLVTPLFKPATQMDFTNIKQRACDAHIIVKQSGQPNYLNARIKVPTEHWQLACPLWELQ